jgi:hypothetical protein
MEVSEKALSFASQIIESTSLYDFMEINEDMALLVVKTQLTHFRIQKIIEEEC